MELFCFSGFLYALVSFIILLFISWFIFRLTDFYIWKIPPGPVGIPLLGYAPFLSKHFYEDLGHLNKKYGKLCSATVFKTRYVFTSDYDTAKELLCHPATFGRPQHIFYIVPGKAGFSGMSGKEWLEKRRCFLHGIRNVGMGKGPWVENVQEEVLKIIDCINCCKGEPMDICSLLSNSARKNIIVLIFGQEFLSRMTDADLKLMSEGDTVINELLKKSMIFSVFPWLLTFLLKFNIAGYSAGKEVIDKCAEIFKKSIEERLKMSFENEDPTDFITQYFQEVKEKSHSGTIEDSSVECLTGDISVFVSTSRTAIVVVQWFLLLMAAYPDIQAKVHGEIDGTIGRNSIINWDDRKTLPYLQACILEVYRWVTVFPVWIPRCAQRTFEFHGYTIPRGTVIVCNSYGAHRNSKYWNDAERYMPERFLKNNAERLHNLEGYAPFSFGKRNCPFEQIASMLTFLYVAGIIQRFEVRTPSGAPPDLSFVSQLVFEPKIQDLCFITRE